MLDLSQAESQFLFQKHRSNYLLLKVTFLSMALDFSLCTWYHLSFLLVSMSDEQNVYCTPFSSFHLLLASYYMVIITEYAILTTADEHEKGRQHWYIGIFFVLRLLGHYSENNFNT